MRSHEEAQEQSALIEWCGWMAHKIPVLNLIFHVPNGGFRNEIEAANLKRQGVKSGVPDLFLPVARKHYHGIFIEMKTKNGVVSPTQKEWIKRLNSQGYLAVVCRGADEAMKVLKDYLQFDFKEKKDSKRISDG